MALAAIGNSNHPADLVAFHHAALFSPTLDTLETAITNQYLPPLPRPHPVHLKDDTLAWNSLVCRDTVAKWSS